MAASYRSRFLGIMRQNEREMTRLFSALAASVAREVTRRADRDGIVPKSATYAIQAEAGALVMRFFLGLDANGDRAPFTTLRDGSVFPLSPYSRVLWNQIEAATRNSVEQQANTLRRQLRNAPDVIGALQTARLNPFAEARRLSEQVVFRPNPLAQYDPPHLWVDPRGYTLSDRIWRTAGNTRRRLDLFLEQRIAAGDSALDIARDAETFLRPNRKLRRTSAPYGRDASFDAMRLARTEITRAAAQASETSAALNPFVQGMSVVLSPSHPKYDICDVAAAHGAWPVGEIPAQYQIPLHPHCLCSYRYEMIDNPGEILDEYREEIRGTRRALTAMIGPLQVMRFTHLLLSGLSVVGG